VVSGTVGSILHRLLYWSVVAILVATPAASFILASELEIRPRAFGVFTFMALGIAVSLPLTLLVARLVGQPCYEDYCRSLEERSTMNRRAITTTWVILVVLVQAAGLASLAAEGE
jgi:hypothetical protein